CRILCSTCSRSTRSSLFPSTTLFRSLNAIAKTVDDADAGAIRSEVTRVELVGNADGRGSRIDARSRHLERAAVEIGSDHLEAASDRKSTRLNSSHGSISYAVFCLKKT